MKKEIKNILGYVLVGGAVACIHFGNNVWILIASVFLLAWGIRLIIDNRMGLF